MPSNVNRLTCNVVSVLALATFQTWFCLFLQTTRGCGGCCNCCNCCVCCVCCVCFGCLWFVVCLLTCSLPFNACGQMTKSMPNTEHPVRIKTTHVGPHSPTQHVHTGQLPAHGVGRAVAFCHTQPENTSCPQRPLKETLCWRETESVLQKLSHPGHISDSPPQHRESTARMPHLKKVVQSRLVLLCGRLRPARTRVALFGRWSPLVVVRADFKLFCQVLLPVLVTFRNVVLHRALGQRTPRRHNLPAFATKSS